MTTFQKFLIGLFVVLGFGGGVFVAKNAITGGGGTDLNPGDLVLRASDPQVGAAATAAQRAQLQAISTAMVIYRASGVYEPF
jgi:hypothetical protein